ncbi:MAG: hypothetical protein Q9168_007315 [Polycauliona sp. 1 TL-2023]
MQGYSNYSFEELRLADYNQDRRYGLDASLSAMANTVQNLSRRLDSSEKDNIQLRGEIARLQLSQKSSIAATKLGLCRVQSDLAGLRCDLICDNGITLRKSKTFAPSTSLPPQTPQFNPFASAPAPSQQTATTSTAQRNLFFPNSAPGSTPVTGASLFTPASSTPLFGPPLSTSLFGQASGSSQCKPASSTSSLFGPPPNTSLFGQASNNPANNPASSTPTFFVPTPAISSTATPVPATPSRFTNTTSSTPSTNVPFDAQKYFTNQTVPPSTVPSQTSSAPTPSLFGSAVQNPMNATNLFGFGNGSSANPFTDNFLGWKKK